MVAGTSSSQPIQSPRPAQLTTAHLEALATADAFARFGLDRRQALWATGPAAQDTPDTIAGTLAGVHAPTLRVLATTGGITLPVFNVSGCFGRMSGQRLQVTSTGEVPLDELLARGVRAAPDITALAAIEDDRLSILVWHYHDDDRPGPDAAVTCTVRNLPVRSGELSVAEHRVDAVSQSLRRTHAIGEQTARLGVRTGRQSRQCKDTRATACY